MAIQPPNNGLLNETGQQYYQGAQGFRGDGANRTFTTTFDTDLYLGNWNPNNENYGLNNFKFFLPSNNKFNKAADYFPDHEANERLDTYSIDGIEYKRELFLSPNIVIGIT